MSAFRVLHLSDIHIGNTYINSKEIALKIISDLYHNGLYSIKSIIVTGDIFDGQVTVNKELVMEAVSFFKAILSEINAMQDNTELNVLDFIFVPGNHDIVRSEDSNVRWKKYNNFLLEFYGEIPKHYNKEHYAVVKPYHHAKIVFIGFNSVQLEKKLNYDRKFLNYIQSIDNVKMIKMNIDKTNLVNILKDEVANEYDDYGEIPMRQITDVSREIKKLDGYNVVALLHHHFYLFPEVVQKYGDTSLVRNYANLIQQLQYMKVKTVLHGHKHFDLERPLITEDYYHSTDSIIDIFAGGTVGSNRKDRHTFSIIDFYDEKDDIKLIQRKFIYNGESLSITKKQIPPKNISDRIVKLNDILKTMNYDVYNIYDSSIVKINKNYDICKKIIDWVSQALTGFSDVQKYLDKDYRNVLFLLYAVNYRTLCYKYLMEKNTNDYQAFEGILKETFEKCLLEEEFDVDIDEFHKIFRIKKLNILKEKCDILINKAKNKKSKQYMAFSMVGVFFTDLYMVLTEYADDFYNDTINYKVNIRLEQGKFHQDVPVPRIEIRSDSDRRSVYVQLLCNEATAHKIAVLFVKEFDLLINKFEDYFKIIGLKLYYLLPKIEKDHSKDALDNYNFEAYIPTLLPLLTGDNIYPSKEVFARELIQNSVDAVAVRDAQDDSNFNKTIYIEMGIDENKRKYFKIRDYGTGMDRFKIERYFTSIGRSFYSGNEYEELGIEYRPISNFGIGFLSSFMVCKEIDVKTKYFELGSEGLRLHIPNYEGCFFVEREENFDVGTEIKLYLNDGVEFSKITDYIKNVILDIKYDISIEYVKVQPSGEKVIPAYNLRKNVDNNCDIFFVPFKENGDVLNIDWLEEVNSCRYIHKYEYGLIFGYNKKREQLSDIVLNAGILVGQSSLFNILSGKKERPSFRDTDCFVVYANFPSNWIQIDVSREISTSFTPMINKLNKNNPENTIGIKIAKSLIRQLENYVVYSKNHRVNTPVIYINDLIAFAYNIYNADSEFRKTIFSMRYVLFFKITDNGILYILDHMSSDHGNSHRFDLRIDIDRELKKIFELLTLSYGPVLGKVMDRLKELSMYDEHIIREVYHSRGKRYDSIRVMLSIVEKLKIKNSNKTKVFFILMTMMMFKGYNRKEDIYGQSISILTNVALRTFTISDIVNGRNEIRIERSDIEALIEELGAKLK